MRVDPAATATPAGADPAAPNDDGGYEAEVQRPDGAIVEVRLDGSRQVLGVDLDG